MFESISLSELTAFGLLFLWILSEALKWLPEHDVISLETDSHGDWEYLEESK